MSEIHKGNEDWRKGEISRPLNQTLRNHKPVIQTVRYANRTRKLKQAEIAKEAGVTQSYISKLMNELTEMESFDNIVNVLEVCGYELKLQKKRKRKGE